MKIAKLQLVKIIKCYQAVVLLSAAVEGSPHAFARIIGEGRLLQVLFQGLKSPLAVEGLSKLFISLRKSVFDAEEETLGQIISTVTLQVVCPAKHQSKAWTKVALNNSLTSVLDKVIFLFFKFLIGTHRIFRIGQFCAQDKIS